MKALIAIAALLASVAVSAGELDGKALTCFSEAMNLTKWLEFKDGNAIHWSAYADGTEATLIESNAGRYLAEPTSVHYRSSPDSFLSWVLDRKTLALQSMQSDHEVWWEYQCEALPSLDALYDAMEAERLEWQSRIDERMKDNKI